MNVLSVYDGMACGMIAFKELGIPIDNYEAFEIDKYAVKTSQHNFPEIKHNGDVFEADFTKYEGVDYLIGGSPCFVAGTKVITYDGIKSIEDIEIGDSVLTHFGRYKPVKETMKRKVDSTVIVKVENSGIIQCTKEHPFYIKNIKRVWNNEAREYKRVSVDDFEWANPINFKTLRNSSNAVIEKTYTTSVCDDIKEIPLYNGTFVSINKTAKVLKNTIKIDDPNVWYLIGRWLGDGWFCYKYKQNGKKISGIKICCGKHETEYLIEKIEKAGYAYTISNEKTVDKFQISNVELATYLMQFGNGAINKSIPGFVTRLPNNLAESFLNGYFDADGHNDDYVYSYTTISKNLAYGIKYMVNKYYKVSCSISSCKNSNLIDGRKCNTNTLYVGTFHREKRCQSHFIVEDNYILSPYKSVVEIKETEYVYNISVEDDESYTANGIVVHNCTYWSIAQKNNRETEASGMGWELFSQYVRALHEAKPKYFLYENNKSMSQAIRKSISDTFGFEPICVNSALVSAQNRQRLYWCGIRQENGTYRKANINQPEDLGILLRDVLDTNALAMRDNGSSLISSAGRTTYREYFIKNQGNMAAELSEKEMDYMVRDHQDQRWSFLNKPGQDDKSKCVVANYYKGVPYNIVAEPINETSDGKAQCIRATCYKDGIRNIVGNEIDRKTGVAEPVNITDNGKSQTIKAQYYKNSIANFVGYESTYGASGVAEPVNATEEGKSQTLKAQYYKSSVANFFNGDGGMKYAATGVAESEQIGALPRPNGELSTSQAFRIYSVDGKSVTLKGCGGGAGGKTGLYADRVPDYGIDNKSRPLNASYSHKGDALPTEETKTKKSISDKVYEVKNGMITVKGKQYPIKLKDGLYTIRKLSVSECMRLQTVPEWYEFPVSNTQAYKMLGNGWTVRVIMWLIASTLDDDNYEN